MKSQLIILSVLAALLLPAMARAQQYSNNWYKVSGGGGTSTNGTYSISGTIGQHDAGGPMTGGGYSVTGGFWAIYALQTSGAPKLYLTHSGNTVTVYWQDISGWTLQQSSSLNPPIIWTVNTSWTTTGGTNYLTITPPKGNLFFRLSGP